VGIKNKLKEIRMREFMMSSNDFAKKLNVKLSTYSQWEAGANTPNVEKAFEVARILNKTIIEIWYEE